MKSMTAFGRAQVSHSLGDFSVEIQSVNRKHLDVKVLLPEEFDRFEIEIQKWLAERVGRGQVVAKIYGAYASSYPLGVRGNLALARQIHGAAREIVDELGLQDKESLVIQLLTRREGVIAYTEDWKDESAYLAVLFQALEEAFQPFEAMRSFEGKKLGEDFEARIAWMKQEIEKIAARSADATTKLKEKLKKALEEVLPGRVENEERLLREVCLYADRVDIEEEIVRFRSHLCHFLEVMTNSGSVGKTLEFILQEMGREVNTIGSKGADIEISRSVVAIKTELERLREQVQNVE